MKNIIIATAIAMTFITSAWATDTVHVHEQVNNAQAPAHQVMSSSQKSATEGTDTKMMDMDQHQKAMMEHGSMKNGSACAHQQMEGKNKTMMDCQGMGDINSKSAKTFAQADEHEKAAIAHETMGNGQSGTHQEMAKKHLSMEKSN